MTEATPRASFRDIPRDLLRNRVLQVLVAIAALIEIYNLAVITSYTSTQKAREITAVAENAVMRQEAEANLAEAKAINETQVARYAERRQAAEGRKATAIADKTRYEAAVAEATARYAEIHAKAEAEAQELQADLVNQQEQIQTQLNSYVERRKYAEAEKAEAKAGIINSFANRSATGSRSDFDRECADKFESLWTVYEAISTVWEGEAIKAKFLIHKARCGITAAQVQRFQKEAQRMAANAERDFCKTPPPLQKYLLPETAELLKRAPNCSAYATALNEQPAQPAEAFGSGPGVPSSQSGVSFRVKSEVSDGKLNLRDGPGMRHDIIVEMPVGALLRQIGDCTGSDDGVTRDPWCNVDWNGTKGWASSSGLEKVQNAGTASAVVAPSFDCQTSTGADERVICGDPGLSQLDRQLAQRYAATLQSAEAGSVNDTRAAQRAWIKQRQACASDLSCLRVQYEIRLQQLQR